MKPMIELTRWIMILIKNDELVVEIVRLLEANEKFEKDVKSLEDSLAHPGGDRYRGCNPILDAARTCFLMLL